MDNPAPIDPAVRIERLRTALRTIRAVAKQDKTPRGERLIRIEGMVTHAIGHDDILAGGIDPNAPGGP